MIAVTAATVAGVWAAAPVLPMAMAVAAAMLLRLFDAGAATWMLAVVVVAAGLGVVRGAQATVDLQPQRLGGFDGWVTVVGEPRPYERSTRAIVSIEGQRFELWSRDAAERRTVGAWRGGDRVRVSGDRRALDVERARRVAWQHVVGRFTLRAVHETAPGSLVARSSNHVRRAIERGAAVLPGDHPALFRGLVVGDRRDQPDEMVARFRASGLSHLTVVSGLNVALLLTVAAPVLRRCRPWTRWAATLALVVWFVSLTRFEPSIVRAGAMATISATAFVLGRERAPFRVLCVAVTVLVVVDPLLVHSVGFWLSVGATAGVCTVGPWLADRLSWLGPLATPVGITLGAQVGVALPLILTFGHVPLVSLPANLLAVPVASLVKLYGLPAGLIAGWVPWAAEPLMFPCRVGVRWIDVVAAAGERHEPGGAATWVGWSLIAVGVGLAAAMNRAAMKRAAISPADEPRGSSADHVGPSRLR